MQVQINNNTTKNGFLLKVIALWRIQFGFSANIFAHLGKY